MPAAAASAAASDDTTDDDDGSGSPRAVRSNRAASAGLAAASTLSGGHAILTGLATGRGGAMMDELEKILPENEDGGPPLVPDSDSD